MKKLTKSTLSLMLVLCMLLLSFSACGPTDAEREQGLVDKEQLYFSASSIEEMKEMFSNGEIQPKHENDIFEKVINNENLNFDEYNIKQIVYTPYQDNSGNFTGSVELAIYWHGNWCPSYDSELGKSCTQYRFNLICSKDRIGDFITQGYTEINDSKLYYSTQTLNDSIAYVYLINDHYYCRYNISSELADKEEISNQLLEICRDIESELQGKFTVEDIKEGTKYSEIVEILGTNGENVGSGAIIYEWQISDEEYLYVWFNSTTASGGENFPADLIASSVEIRKERLHLAPVD